MKERPVNDRFRISIIVAAALLAVAAVSYAQGEPAPKEEATLYPVPDYSGGILERKYLTGTWDGSREWLADRGIQFKFSALEIVQGVWSGGADRNGDGEGSGSADYRILLDTNKMGLWPGGFIEIHGESYWGDAVNFNAGTLLPVNFDAQVKAAGNGTYLSHVTLTQFLSENFAVVLGRIDTSQGDANDYAHGVGDTMFMNGAFTLNPVTWLSSPYATLGGGCIYLFGEEKQHMATLMVYDGENQIGVSGFDTLFEDNTTIGSAVRLKTDFFDRKGHQWLGFLYGSGRYDPQTQDPRLIVPIDLLPGGPEPGSESEDSHWAVFYNFDQQIVGDEETGQDWGVFGRIGFADRDTSVIESFWSVGFGGTGLIPGRENDRFGVGWYRMVFTDERLEFVLPRNDESGFEVYYTAALTPWADLSADMQFVDAALNGSDHAVVAGLRLRVTF
jgi:porin